MCASPREVWSTRVGLQNAAAPAGEGTCGALYLDTDSNDVGLGKQRAIQWALLTPSDDLWGQSQSHVPCVLGASRMPKEPAAGGRRGGEELEGSRNKSRDALKGKSCLLPLQGKFVIRCAKL